MLNHKWNVRLVYFITEMFYILMCSKLFLIGNTFIKMTKQCLSIFKKIIKLFLKMYNDAFKNLSKLKAYNSHLITIWNY